MSREPIFRVSAKVRSVCNIAYTVIEGYNLEILDLRRFVLYEPHGVKNGILPMQKQRRRSASQ